MIKLLDKSEISIFNYFYVFCMFVFAGSATVFARNLGDLRTVGNTFALAITICFFIMNRIRFLRPYFISIAVFLIYAIVTSINNRMINPFWISQWIIWLTLAYGLCQGFREELPVVVETVLFHLSIIALVFWVLHVIYPDFIVNFVQSVAFSKPYEEECNVLANIIVYTVNDLDRIGDSDFSLLVRNAGFAWEPGAFASMLCLGIFCNMLRTDFDMSDLSLWVLFLALLSTESTTGILVFLAMMIMWLVLNRKYSYLFILIPVLFAIYNLPFAKEKLMTEIENMQHWDISTISGSAGRLLSLQLNFEEFLRHPIIGLGGYAEGTWLALNGYDIATISGIGHMLVYFGAVMTTLFLVLLIKSCKYFREISDSSNAWLLIVVIIGMMVSYSLWKQPIYIAFWMFGVYAYDDEYDDEDDDEDECDEACENTISNATYIRRFS